MVVRAMMYSYECQRCGPFTSQRRGDTHRCPNCELPSQRRWSFRTATKGFEPHFNHSVGAYVSSSRHFDEMLKIRGDEAGTQMARIDPGDMPRPTQDDGIFDTQARTLREKGFTGDDGRVRLTDEGNFIPQR
jgi:hypothetical protein